jgi:hypothetical protein
MKKELNKLKLAGALFVGLLCASTLPGQTSIGQWDFESGDLTATAGSNLGDLTYSDGPTGATKNNTLFGTTTTFGITNINGTVAKVMKFPVGSLPMGFLMPTPPANGGGSLCNNYTVIFDMLYPAGGQFRPLIQMDDGSFDHISAFLAVAFNDSLEATNTSGSALPSAFIGKILPNTWYRIGFVVNETAGEINFYTNGVQVGTLTGVGTLDDPYALLANSTLPIFSSTVTNVVGYVNSAQIRDAALNPGQMAALGAVSAAGIPITIPPVHSFIQARTPGLGSTGIGPLPAVHVDLNQGDGTVNVGSVTLSFDGTVVPATVAGPSGSIVTIDYAVTNILDPLSIHTLKLVFQDSFSSPGFITNIWTFTVANYENITLPPPVYFENFDELAEGSLPAGWSVTNRTVSQIAGYDLNVSKSDAYLDWVVISLGRLTSVFGGDRRDLPPIVLNGVLIDSLIHENFAYAESDNRQNTGGQVNMMFTGDYNLTGVSNVFLAFNNIYEQNQDNLGSVEYSIDQGVTWLPALYMLDDGTTDGDGSDVVTNGVTGLVDPFATFGTPRNDQAYTLAYSNWIGAVVSTNLTPFIQGRANDDSFKSKRIEVLRLAQADRQAHVRVRFCQAGTSSWYFGIDDFGLYSINTPSISVQPQSQTVDANTPVTFSVVASGPPPLTYQWTFNGVNIAQATNTSYTIASVSPTNAGTFQVTVKNPSGSIKSAPASLTVNTNPVIVARPVGEIADPGASVTFAPPTTGGRPLTHIWYKNGTPVSSSLSSTLLLNNLQAGNAGNYMLVASNSYGAVTSSIAALKIWSGSLSSNLVVHLPFDGNMNDTSGRGNNAAYAVNGGSSSPTARYVSGQIGQAFKYTTSQDASIQEYATLGYPLDLQFGDTSDFSVAFWANWTNQTDDLPFISNKDWNSSSYLGWGVFTQSGGNFRENITGPNSDADKFSTSATPSVLKDGNWHHVVMSVLRAPFLQSAYVYGYIDGNLVNKSPMTLAGTIDTFGTPFSNHQNLTSSQASWAVNIGQDGTGVYYDGGSAYDIDAMIDDVGIWRRALTANEVKGIYTTGVGHRDLSLAAGDQRLSYTVSGGVIHITWPGSPTLKLQKTTSLNPAVWVDVPSTLGASSANVSITGGSAFFKLAQ